MTIGKPPETIFSWLVLNSTNKHILTDSSAHLLGCAAVGQFSKGSSEAKTAAANLAHAETSSGTMPPKHTILLQANAPTQAYSIYFEKPMALEISPSLR